MNFYNYLSTQNCSNCKGTIPPLNDRGEWDCVCCGFSFERKDMRGRLKYKLNSYGLKIDWVEPRKQHCKYCYKTQPKKY